MLCISQELNFHRHVFATILNIQRIEVSPLTEDYPLWQESNSNAVLYDDACFTATQNILDIAISYGLDNISPLAATIYEVFSTTIQVLLSSTQVEISEIYYSWECATSVSFAYVRFEYQSDDYQQLTVVGTKCYVDVACIMDVERFIQHESGAIVPQPAQCTGSYAFTAAHSLYNTNSRAAYVFLHTTEWTRPVYDYVEEIDVSAPGSQEAFFIDPPKPLFPLQLD